MSINGKCLVVVHVLWQVNPNRSSQQKTRWPCYTHTHIFSKHFLILYYVKTLRANPSSFYTMTRDQGFFKGDVDFSWSMVSGLPTITTIIKYIYIFLSVTSHMCKQPYVLKFNELFQTQQ